MPAHKFLKSHPFPQRNFLYEIFLKCTIIFSIRYRINLSTYFRTALFMNDVIKLRNQVLLLTLIIGFAGSALLYLFSPPFSYSFFFGAVVSAGYIWHLGHSILKFSAENKNIYSILRLALTVVFMVLIGQVLALNIIFICAGFLSNHLALFIIMGCQIVKDRKNQNCN